MERIKEEKIERLSDKADKHDQHRLSLGRFGVEKVRFFIKNALCRSSELCFLPRRGAHFHKNYEKIMHVAESWTKKRKLADVVHQLGGLVRSRAAEPTFSRAAARKKKSRPATNFRRDSARIPQVSHFWTQCPLGCSRKNHKTTTTDGTREMRGSNTPWAKGPANFPHTDRVATNTPHAFEDQFTAAHSRPNPN